jgi:hypothetical protein
VIDGQRLTSVAEALADGTEPDWDAAASGASGSEQLAIRNLRDAATIARARAQGYLSSLSARRFEPPPPLLPGATWGALRIVHPLGRGHFGHVYRAWDPALERDVALKILNETGEAGGADLPAVVAEGRLMARVRHPNVVTIYGAQRAHGSVGMWMELVEGPTLEAELRARGPFPGDEVVRIGVDLCEALAAVHGAGLVHRDVKAQNVLRNMQGRAVLGDFGAAAPVAGSDLAGTPLYAAPEVLRGAAADARADIYSLGVLLFHLATGAYPVPGGSLRDIRDAHVAGRRTALRTLQPRLPPRAVDVIERALAPDPEQRFVGAARMGEALRACQEWRGSRWRVPVAAAALLMTILGSLLWLWPARLVPAHGAGWVLVTAFENRTGDPLLDGTIAHVLAQELTRSPAIDVVPRERIDDVLRLMRRPAGTPLSLAAAGELALRDGNVRAIVTGAVAKRGTGYELTARVMNVGTPDGAPAVVERATTTSDLLPAAVRLARRIGQQLGAPAITTSGGASLARVTTPSLLALQRYSRAADLLAGEGPGNPPAAEALLREAVAADPEFAMAHYLLGRAISLQPGRPLMEGRRLIDRAYELSASAGRVERLFLDATHHDLESIRLEVVARAPREQWAPLAEQAVVSYETLLREVPEFFNAHERVVVTLERLGRGEDVRRFTTVMVAARPHSDIWNTRAAIEAMRAGDADVARAYARTAEALPRRAYAHGSPERLITWLRLFDAREAWLRGDAMTALADVDRLATELPSLEGELRVRVGQEVSAAYRALGRVATSLDVLTRVGAPNRVVLTAALDGGDLATARRLLAAERAGPSRALWLAGAFVRVGNLATARQVLLEDASRASTPYAARVEGEIALAEGRTEAAVASLTRAATLVADEAFVPEQLRVALALAGAHEARGEVAQAIHVLEAAVAQPARLLADGFAAAPDYQRGRTALARLYTRAGDVVRAHAVEAEVRQRVAVDGGATRP